MMDRQTHSTQTAKDVTLPYTWSRLPRNTGTPVHYSDAGNSSWSKNRTPQEAVPYLTSEGVGTQIPITHFVRHGQLTLLIQLTTGPQNRKTAGTKKAEFLTQHEIITTYTHLTFRHFTNSLPNSCHDMI